MSIERDYEELRAVIDGGSESMTHKDALRQVKYWRKRSGTRLPVSETKATHEFEQWTCYYVRRMRVAAAIQEYGLEFSFFLDKDDRPSIDPAYLQHMDAKDLIYVVLDEFEDCASEEL